MKLSKKNYLKYKAININGFEIDLMSLVYGFAHGDEYPKLKKKEDTGDRIKFTCYYYFKHYDGTGEYLCEEYFADKKEIDPSKNINYFIAKDRKERIIENSNRFNLNRLIALCEANA